MSLKNKYDNVIIRNEQSLGLSQCAFEYLLNLEKENIQLKIQISAREEEYRKLEDNWKKVKDIIEDERMTHWSPNPLFLTELLNKMQELERGVSDE